MYFAIAYKIFIFFTFFATIICWNKKKAVTLQAQWV